MGAITQTAKEAWSRLLSQAGTDGYVELVTGYGEVDVITGTRSTDTLVETSLKAIVSNYDASEIDGNLVMENDLRVTIDGTAIITKKDMIKIGDDDLYRIVSIRRVNLDGQLIGYKLQVRL